MEEQSQDILLSPKGNTWIAPCPAEAYADLEYRKPNEIGASQFALFRKHLRYAAEHSPFYRELFRREGIDVEGLRSPDDIASIPCTEKGHIAEQNDAFLAVPPERVVDVCLTSATTSDTPCALPQTTEDLARLAYNEQQAFRMVGMNASHKVMVCAALDRCFMAGLAYFMGGSRLGATMIRAGAGSAAQHWQTIRLTRPDYIVGVPSLMRHIAEYARDHKEDPKSVGLKKLIAIGEPCRDGALQLLPAARKIEDLWQAPIYSTYASTEIATAFAECEERCGGHVRPELVMVEIVDEAGRPVAQGEKGEVVVTPLGVLGMPLVRFRTGDISYLIDEPCACGRQSPRLAPILGRKNQMLKYKGTTVFPNAILAALEGRDDVTGAYVEAHRDADGGDRIVVCLHCRDSAVSPEQLAEDIRARIRVMPEVELISEAQLSEKVYQSGKRKRSTFFDLRDA